MRRIPGDLFFSGDAPEKVIFIDHSSLHRNHDFLLINQSLEMEDAARAVGGAKRAVLDFSLSS
ncbi:MAG: hypothetical protein ACOC6B_01255 [Thermodesulfobacteriota bacterium]